MVFGIGGCRLVLGVVVRYLGVLTLVGLLWCILRRVDLLVNKQ